MRWLRYIIGTRLIWWGYAILPRGVKEGFSFIAAVGLEFTEQNPAILDEVISKAHKTAEGTDSK